MGALYLKKLKMTNTQMDFGNPNFLNNELAQEIEQNF
jgi:hypothetical protein